ncbi:MAG: hypothetical protein GW808_09105 [Sphingomonadales bacterium]|nr:hypothetical protein [Sphingomonadales bacterium]PIX67704.1 MAG: hypothetical protein COZ43_00270 [Sphingomonadales bacterium CG_4_10_14_3_um_filter_58_15]NCO49453.1 hypothetical protein [Sphingomonadales bacterium]NCP00768.1 hypothetical protein [Sphingomonadales bacterium]NCP43958.1 hypothetical protein [Sphingomonadales bacterium]
MAIKFGVRAKCPFCVADRAELPKIDSKLMLMHGPKAGSVFQVVENNERLKTDGFEIKVGNENHCVDLQNYRFIDVNLLEY